MGLLSETMDEKKSDMQSDTALKVVPSTTTVQDVDMAVQDADMILQQEADPVLAVKMHLLNEV